MDRKMRVDVIMPSYGHAAFLREAIGSVIAQAHTGWRLFVQDDLSPDNSYAIVHEFDDERIVTGRNETNLGTYATQQIALEKGNAPYVSVINSDDVWHPKKLARQLALLEETGAEFVYALGSRIDAKGNRLADDQHGGWPREPVQDLHPWLARENRVLASSVVFRREGLRFDRCLRTSGDWVALLRASERGKAAFVDADLSSWRMHAANSFVRSPGQVSEEIAVRRAILAGYPAPSEARAECARHLAALYALRGETSRSVGAASRAAREEWSRASLRRFAAALMGGGALRGGAPLIEKRPVPEVEL
ncbi:hypothetical protein BH11ARM2_BH11ARM2_16440 [soil metagenome]